LSLLAWLAVGVLATYRLTHDLISDKELEGPFRIYDFVRWLFRREFWPEWVRDGATCAYCLSFWIGGMFSLLLPIYSGMSWARAVATFILCTFALSGAVVYHYRKTKVMFGVDPESA
jgi:hypothetical protein